MKSLTVAVLLALTLTGCGVAAETAGKVGNAASTAAVCADAVRIATTPPDLTDPKAAADRAHAAAGELEGLASRAANTTAGEAIDKLATTLRETTVDDVATGSAEWLRQRTEQVSALTQACSGN
ncbi:bacteriophage spanin2 family protein [Amycolatopsis sp. CA-128772]|uniref:bacteriophage spanin2 family protein n=1 Tax=Amycolatopsis sp. CA-128772 TaxID=2073159 RepID=UPI000CD1C5FE|nr:bacteriophage spanin2 family protein [Amycolatopsis sp. CA-128772]